MIIDANQKLVLVVPYLQLVLYGDIRVLLLEEYFKANSKPDTAFGGSAEGQTTTSN